MADIIRPANQAVTFNDKSSGSPTGYEWDFGDGTLPISGPKTVVHTYTVPGVYTITHKVTGAGGTTTCTKTIEITAAAGGIPVVGIAVAAVAIGGLMYIMTQSGGNE